jgi:DNA-binding transcriptional MerR regulator
MKIAELSARSGFPVGTIKFYLRERLLPRGRLKARNQADYDHRHLERLRLVGALTATAGIGIGEAREIIRALEAPSPRAGAAFRMAFDRMERRAGAIVSADEARELERSKTAIAAFLRAIGWSVDESHGALIDLARSWRAACAVWHPRWLQPTPGLEALHPFAEAMQTLAEIEMPEGAWRPDEDAPATLTAAILGTVLFEPILLAMRRLAHENRARELTQERRQVASVAAKPRAGGTRRPSRKSRAR